ncbi:hypothetical protein J5N97_007198 [Dioscorea zingiberensis]|uniref:Uncharacterized protein n=1 Tax=Dioscorea zingiberensis TaxID=325984 RepID=A0A9D5DEB4_9LILI|nr:hypothetical protein J5N97_007198 [Dioscorea zingiberensis]
MKTIKGKGRIHPSPAPPSAGGCDTMAVLKILPVTILAMIAVLSNEDKEVMAYLVARSVSGAGLGEERRRRKGVHPPALDCGCFVCYTSFWSRWDRSPQREVIHQAIEAFEEHLAATEQASGGGARSRRKDRREKGKKAKDKEIKKVEEEKKLPEGPVNVDDDDGTSSVEEGKKEEAMEMEIRGGEEEEGLENTSAILAAPAAGDKRKDWPDVMGTLVSRLWSLWSPGD